MLVLAGAFFLSGLVFEMTLRVLRSRLCSYSKNVNFLLVGEFPGDLTWRRRNFPASAASEGVFISVSLRLCRSSWAGWWLLNDIGPGLCSVMTV